MAEKASPTGWVVEVVVLSGDGPPTFKYFNAGISDAAKAVAAARKRLDASNANRVEAVRTLSAAEVAALNLKVGEMKPA